MRILNILNNTNLAGTEQASLRFMTGLMQCDYEFRVFSLTPAGAMKAVFLENGILTDDMEYKGAGGWQSFLALKKNLHQIISDFKPDLIMQTSHNALLTFALTKYNVPKILAVHYHHQGVKPNWQWRMIYRLVVKRFNSITFPSNFIKKEAESIAPFIANITRTLRNPLEPKMIPSVKEKETARDYFSIPHDALVIGNSSQLIKRKRLDVFLQTAQKILLSNSNSFFLVAGDGEENKALKDFAKGLGIDRNIIWLGWQRNLTPFYHALDFLLFNSDWDAFPTTPLEAMAYGIPVVASAVNSGLSEVITDENKGYLIDEHNVEKLSTYILNVHRHKLPNTGFKGRETVMEICNYNKCVAELKKIIDDTCSNVS